LRGGGKRRKGRRTHYGEERGSLREELTKHEVFAGRAQMWPGLKEGNHVGQKLRTEALPLLLGRKSSNLRNCWRSNGVFHSGPEREGRKRHPRAFGSRRGE